MVLFPLFLPCTVLVALLWVLRGRVGVFCAVRSVEQVCRRTKLYFREERAYKDPVLRFIFHLCFIFSSLLLLPSSITHLSTSLLSRYLSTYSRFDLLLSLGVEAEVTMVSVPRTMKAWKVEGVRGVDSLVLHEDIPVPEPGEHEVLVKFHAASLNFRDLAITNGKLSYYQY